MGSHVLEVIVLITFLVSSQKEGKRVSSASVEGQETTIKSTAHVASPRVRYPLK